MPPASAPSPSGARRTPSWARRWGENVQWGMKAWSGNRHRGDLPMIILGRLTTRNLAQRGVRRAPQVEGVIVGDILLVLSKFYFRDIPEQDQRALENNGSEWPN